MALVPAGSLPGLGQSAGGVESSTSSPFSPITGRSSQITGRPFGRGERTAGRHPAENNRKHGLVITQHCPVGRLSRVEPWCRAPGRNYWPILVPVVWAVGSLPIRVPSMSLPIRVPSISLPIRVPSVQASTGARSTPVISQWVG